MEHVLSTSSNETRSIVLYTHMYSTSLVRPGVSSASVKTTGRSESDGAFPLLVFTLFPSPAHHSTSTPSSSSHQFLFNLTRRRARSRGKSRTTKKKHKKNESVGATSQKPIPPLGADTKILKDTTGCGVRQVSSPEGIWCSFSFVFFSSLHSFGLASLCARSGLKEQTTAVGWDEQGKAESDTGGGV